MYPEAVAFYQEAIKLGDNSPSIQVYLGATYAKAGEREKAQAILKRLQTSKEYVSPGELAVLYAALGERSRRSHRSSGPTLRTISSCSIWALTHRLTLCARTRTSRTLRGESDSRN